MYFDLLEDLLAAVAEIERQTRVPPLKGHTTRSCSPVVIERVKFYFPNVEARSDSTLLRQATANSAVLWNSLTMPEFEAQMTKLRSIVVAMQPQIATLRAELTRYTAIFKMYYVPRGEDLGGSMATSPHITLARKVLRADRPAVLAHMKVIESKMYDRLSDKYTESYPEIWRKVLQMRDSPGRNKLERGEWLMCAIACCGCRKGEPLWPEIEFEPYFFAQEEEPEWVTSLVEAVGASHVIVQKGVLKDKSQYVRRYNGEAAVNQRRVVKPTLFLPAAEVCDIIKKLRQNIQDRDDFAVRDRDFHNLFKVVQKYFPEAAQKATAKGWTLSTHYLRKLYSVASYHVYEGSVAAVTGRQMDRCVWSSMVLGHDGAVSVTLRYMNVDVTNCKQEEGSKEIKKQKW